MKKSDAIAHYGNKARLATAAGVTRQAVQKWRELVPPMAAIRIESASEGRLRFDPTLYEGGPGKALEREGAVEVGHSPEPPPGDADGTAVNGS